MGTDSEFSTQKPTSLKRTNTISMSKEAAEMKRRTVPALPQQMQPQVTSEQQHNQTRKANVISKDPPRGHYSIPDRYIPPHSAPAGAREEEPPKSSKRHRVKVCKPHSTFEFQLSNDRQSEKRSMTTTHRRIAINSLEERELRR